MLEAAVSEPRFNMNPLYSHLHDHIHRYYEDELDVVASFLDAMAIREIMQGLVRFAFLIETVKVPKIDSTKFALRWDRPLTSSDPRYASYDGCLSVFDHLVAELVTACQVPEKLQLLRNFRRHSQLPYELPIDYVERRQTAGLHSSDNVEFFWGETPQLAIALREYLLNSAEHSFAVFFRKAYEKIRVKSYLTDRTLTGDHKTNREKRWEAHPLSVHFSLRRDCMGIEVALINQLCYFAGFPANLQHELESRGLICFEDGKFSESRRASVTVSRCPITLEPLSYEEFRGELLSQRHGRASYQVGHLHPLKATSDNPHAGHTARNISWISAQGNRIQGEYSVDETRELIFRIISNYRDAGLLS
jgi:hypothetical protein